MSNTILIVATHPDDEVLGCGGTMARYAACGDTVHVLVVTRGVLASTEIVTQVRQEMRNAHDILGVHHAQFLNFPAAQLDTVPRHAIADAIANVIQLLRPSILYLPHHGDLHTDHRIVYLAGLVAARPSHAFVVPRVLTYETVSETDWAPPTPHDAFVPTVYVDITRFLDQKIQAAACFHSQMREPPHTRSLRSLQALATLRGGTVGVGAAEAFVLVREIIGAANETAPQA